MKVISLKGHFFTNGIIDLGMNFKYLKFEIMRPTPWQNTFDIGNLVDLENIYFTIFAHVIMLLGNLFSYIQNSKWRFKVFKSWFMEGPSDNNGLLYQSCRKNHSLFPKNQKIGFHLDWVSIQFYFLKRCVEKSNLISTIVLITMDYDVSILIRIWMAL